MLDIDMRFKQGILFIRLNGILNGDTCMKLEESISTLIEDNGIRVTINWIFVLLTLLNDFIILATMGTTDTFDKTNKLSNIITIKYFLFFIYLYSYLSLKYIYLSNHLANAWLSWYASKSSSLLASK